MQKYLIVILIVVVGIMNVAYKVQKNRAKELDEKYSIAVQNIKSYSNNEEKNKALKVTLEQLEYYNDSILKELDNTRKQLKIKDKELNSMHYTVTDYGRTDTVTLKDTIFTYKELNVDTIIGDVWCNTRVGLKYPSYVTISPKFKSEKHIIVSSKKETIEPPKKFFLLRWFQKKHTVLKVNVIEKNPYVINDNSEYVEILK